MAANPNDLRDNPVTKPPPNRGQHCRQQPQRVTSAICADGCATVRSGAKSKPKNRGQTSRRLSNPSFPNLFLTILAIVPTSRRMRRQRPQPPVRRPRKASQQPRPGAENSLHRDHAAIAIATAAGDAADAVAGHKRQARRRRCPLRVGLRAKPPRPTQLRS